MSVQQIIPETTGRPSIHQITLGYISKCRVYSIKGCSGECSCNILRRIDIKCNQNKYKHNPAFVEAGSVYLLTVTSGSVYYTDQDLYPGNGSFSYDTGWYPYGGPYSTTGDLLITTFICPAVGGCTDETACNFDASAEVNDYSCEYPNDSGECGRSRNRRKPMSKSIPTNQHGLGRLNNFLLAQTMPFKPLLLQQLDI